MSIVRLKQGGKYLAMENKKFKLVDSETACADMEQFVMTMDKVNQLYYSFIHIANSNTSERVEVYCYFYCYMQSLYGLSCKFCLSGENTGPFIPSILS